MGTGVKAQRPAGRRGWRAPRPKLVVLAGQSGWAPQTARHPTGRLLGPGWEPGWEKLDLPHLGWATWRLSLPAPLSLLSR